MPANYVLLATQTVGNGGAASVTFANIPQSGYTDLKVVCSVRNTTATTVGNVTFDMQINGLTTGYTGKQLYGSGSSAGSLNRNNVIIGTLNSANDTANTFSNVEIYIPNYTSSNAKSYSVDSVSEGNTSTTELDLLAKLNSTTSAITSLTFLCSFDSFAAGSTFYLYGLAAVGTTPAIAPYASGGDVIANDGTYWYHAFKTTGAFVPAKALTCDVLVVAGGGAGGYRVGGGGGAGGYRLLSTVSALTNSYTITVGAGGTGGTSALISTVGTTSSALGYSASGGGRGGDGPTQQQGSTGGSGGGANGNSTLSGNAGNSGGYSPSEGNAGGGSTFVPTSGAGGGGGGAGGSGTGGVSGLGGNGGAGTNSVSSWLSATALGVSGYIAGGGGGGTESGFTPGTAGSGGAGTGSSSAVAATSGTANTGSGGGGGGCCSVNQNGGNGGSGIVIIRYAMA